MNCRSCLYVASAVAAACTPQPRDPHSQNGESASAAPRAIQDAPVNRSIAPDSGTTTPAAVSARGESTISHEHRIMVDEPKCVPGVCVCRGHVDDRARLNETGPSPEQLGEGLRCIVADFDGNGANDHALPGGEGLEIVILSTANGGFLRAVTIDAGGMASLYPPRETHGPDGEPPSKYPGLLVPNIGLDHAVFLWNGTTFMRYLFRATTS